jgi:hypothetical protein
MVLFWGFLINIYKTTRAQEARASPESPRIQTVIRADPRKADVHLYYSFFLLEFRRKLILRTSVFRGSTRITV